MSNKHRKIDRIMLAVSLFTVTGAVLAYNLQTALGGTLTVSLSDLHESVHPLVSAISDSAAAHLTARESVYTAAKPSEPPRDYVLAEPIVRMP